MVLDLYTQFVHIILCAKFVWNWPVDSREFTNVALYSSCFVSSLVEIGPVVSREDENVMTGRRIENGQQVWEKLTLSYIYTCWELQKNLNFTLISHCRSENLQLEFIYCHFWVPSSVRSSTILLLEINLIKSQLFFFSVKQSLSKASVFSYLTKLFLIYLFKVNKQIYCRHKLV